MDYSDLVKNTYDKIAQAYTDKYGNSPFLLDKINKFSSLLPKRARVLDLGCGSGRAAKLLQKKGFEIVGIDFSKAMLKLARSLVPEAEFFEGDVRRIDFADEYFDGLWSNFSLIHISKKDVAGTLLEWNRVLKKEGCLFIGTTHGEDDEQIKDEWLKEGKKIFFHHIARGTLSNYLKSAGFTIEEIGTTEDAPENEDVAILYCFAQKT